MTRVDIKKKVFGHMLLWCTESAFSLQVQFILAQSPACCTSTAPSSSELHVSERWRWLKRIQGVKIAGISFSSFVLLTVNTRIISICLRAWCSQTFSSTKTLVWQKLIRNTCNFKGVQKLFSTSVYRPNATLSLKLLLPKLLHVDYLCARLLYVHRAAWYISPITLIKQHLLVSQLFFKYLPAKSARPSNVTLVYCAVHSCSF